MTSGYAQGINWPATRSARVRALLYVGAQAVALAVAVIWPNVFLAILAGLNCLYFLESMRDKPDKDHSWADDANYK